MSRNDVGPLLKAARAYVVKGGVAAGHSDADVLGAQFGSGITARRAGDGKVVLDIPNHGTMTLVQAVKLGIVKVSR
jgi:hypothetical protein